MKKSVKSFSVFLAVILCALLTIQGCGKKEPASTKTAEKSATKAATSAKTTGKTTSKTTSTSGTSATAGDEDGDSNYGEDQDETNQNEDDEDFEEEPGDGDSDQFRPNYGHDFGGATLTVAALTGTITTPVQYPMNNDRSGPHIYGTDPVKDRLYEWARENEIRYNCKLEIVSYATSMPLSRDRLTTEVLSGIHTADIFNIAPLYSMPTLMVNNIVLPISDYIDFDADPVLSDPYVKNSVTFNGKQWGIYTAPPASQNSLIYNTDIRDREGLEDPMELSLQGQWNWDKFIDVLKNATRDFNGDGVIDQWGMALIGPYAANFVAANKGTIVEYRDGRFEFSALDPATLRALTFISDLFNTHKVAKYDWNIYRNGQAFMDNMWASLAQMKDARVAAIKNYRHVAYPTGPDNPDGKVTLAPLGDCYYVIANTPDPEGLAKFIAYFFQTYNNPDLITSDQDSARNGFQLVYPNDPEAVEYWMKMRSNIDPGKVNWGQWGTPFTTMQDWVQNKVLPALQSPSQSVRSYIDSMYPSLQGEIDSLAKQ